MSYQPPGDKSRQLLQRGLPHLRNGAILPPPGAPPTRVMMPRPDDRRPGREAITSGTWTTTGISISGRLGPPIPLGNCHPEIIEAVHEAHRRYGFQWEHPLRIPLTERLAGLMPGRALPRFSFEVSGTEAVESAIHLALCHTRRRYIISFTSCFHGEGLGTKMVSAYNSNNNLYMEAWAGGVLKAPFPYSENIRGYEPRPVLRVLPRYPGNPPARVVVPAENIAAILIEPGLAEGGNWIPSRDFFSRVCAGFATSMTG